VAYGGGQEIKVVLVEAGECVAEVDGDSVGEAGGEAEHPLFASFSELAICLADLPRCGFC
jgi:hypothetical protein